MKRKKLNELSVGERLRTPKPKFWRRMQNLGIVIGGVAGAIIAAPVALPAAAITVLTYAATVGGVITAVSQFAADPDKAPQVSED